MFHGFSVSIEELRSRYCSEEKPYVIRGDKELGSILSGFYQKNMAHPELAKTKEYYQIKVVELLLYLNTMTVEDRKEVRPYYYKTQMEKIKGIHAQITGNPQTRFTIEELSSMYELSLIHIYSYFYTVAVSYDGFDPNEKTEFCSMEDECEKIEQEIRKKYGGRIKAAYGCSLGAVSYTHLDVYKRQVILR